MTCLTIDFGKVLIGLDDCTPESTGFCYFSKGLVADPAQKTVEKVGF